MIDLSEYLRLPLRVGVQLQREVPMVASLSQADFAAADYFTVLVDNVNHAVLANLKQCAPHDAFLLAHIRGSLVKDRLSLAQTFWPRLVQILGLERILQGLSELHDVARVEQAVFGIRQAINACLLYDQRDLAAGKLLFRLRRVEFSALTQEDYAMIAAFVAQVAQLSRDCDESILAVFKNTDLGEARRAFYRGFQPLLRCFALEEIGAKINKEFERFLQIQRELGSLHPALPMNAEAIARIAAAVDISPAQAQQMVTLFRFAWICRYQQPKHLSDISLKSTVVTWHRGTAAAARQHLVENSLPAILRAQETARRQQADLLRFHEKYPDVPVSSKVFVLSLPRPLFELFWAVKQEEEKLNFITQYTVGGTYFENYVMDLLREAGGTGRIHVLAEGCDRAIRRHFAALLENSVFMKCSLTADGRAKHEDIVPLKLAPDTIMEMMNGVIASPERETVEQCARFIDEVIQNDWVGNIRGLWAKSRDTRQPHASTAAASFCEHRENLSNCAV